MAKVPFYTVDAFTSHAFKGNQAAVCVFHRSNEPDDELKQRLAAEFNLSETAYPLPLTDHDDHHKPHNQQQQSTDSFQTANVFSLRWFTPTSEVPLCGHATLATAHVIFNELGNKNKEIHFETLSGRLSVQKAENNRLRMDFPQYEILSLESSFGHVDGFKTLNDKQNTGIAEQLALALVSNVATIQTLAYAPKAYKLIVAFDPKTTRTDLLKVQVNKAELLKIQPVGKFVKGIILTLAPENPEEQGFDKNVDYVLRYFAPWYGIDEDPATGSAQCAAAPFWSKVLKKDKLNAFQCFPTRGAEFEIEMKNETNRLNIYGQALTIFSGHFSEKILHK